MKIKIKAKSDPCNCQGNTASGCNNERKDEALRDKWSAWVGIILLFGAVTMFIIVAGFVAEDPFSVSNLANWGRAVEVFGIMWFGLAMARWRG